MLQKWAIFQAKVQSALEPILIQAGYSLQIAEASEAPDRDHFVMAYQNANKPRIEIDTLEWIAFDTGKRDDFNWLRVAIGKDRLKVLMGIASDTDMILYDSWKWVTDAELDVCIEEIAQGLKAYLEAG